MSTTAAFFLFGYFAGIALALLRHPKFGIYTYLFAFYMHPPDRWWAAQVPDLRWSLLAGIVALISAVRLEADESGDKWHQTAAGRILVCYVLWMVVQSSWAVTGDYHAEGVELFAKYVALFYVTYRSIRSEEDMRNFFLAHVLGCFYLGWLAFGKDVSGRLEGMGGPGIDDANTFGMHISTAVVFGAALMLRGGRGVRAMVILCMPFVLNGLILTQSRGAFLGLTAAAVAAYFLQPLPTKRMFHFLAALGLALFLMLAPQDFYDRIATIADAASKSESVEESVNTRIELAKVQLQIAERYPLGTGHKGTRALSRLYLDERFLTQDVHSGEGLARSSHNTFLAVLVDQGIPGLVLYLLLVLSMIRMLAGLKRLDKAGLSAEFGAYRMALGASIAAILVAGMFSNYIKAEIMIWCLALVCRLKVMALAATAPESEARPVDSEPARAFPRQHKHAWRQQA